MGKQMALALEGRDKITSTAFISCAGKPRARRRLLDRASI